MVRHPELKRLLLWYLRERGPHTTMPQSKLDPCAVRSLLSHAFYYDFDPATEEFRLRVAGEEIRRILPGARRGAALAEIVPAKAYDTVRQRLLRVARERAIQHEIGRIYLSIDVPGMGERVALPLADENGAVRQIFGATFYGLSGPTFDLALADDDAAIRYIPLDGLV